MYIQILGTKPSNSAIKLTVAWLALGPLHALTLVETKSSRSAGRAVILTIVAGVERVYIVNIENNTEIEIAAE